MMDETDVAALCDKLLDECDLTTTDAAQFLGHQFDLGLAWVHFPKGHGGLGLPPALQQLVDVRLRAAGAPDPAARNLLGYGMGAPTVMTHGTDEQRAALLRPLFTGEEIWCQLFSEPGAGSDIATLATRAERDGDEWVVNGQKVWTTLGHIAKRAMLVVRTKPDEPKHNGLTYFVLDMATPGVEVRPLYQITGEAEFNEVYLTDVRIPDSARVGEIGGGWRVVLTTLMNERVAIGASPSSPGEGLVGSVLKLWADISGGGPVQRDRLMKLWSEAETLRLVNLRAAHHRTATPGPEGSIGKIKAARVNQGITELMVDLLGAHGMLKPDGYPRVRPDLAMAFGSPQHSFLRARANSIEGGTTEIAKNILAERVLGLPRDPGADKGLPWREIPRAQRD